MRFYRLFYPFLYTLIVLFAGYSCGGGSAATCDPVAQTGCSGGQSCEEVQGGQPACFTPVSVSGTVTDSQTGQPIAGARIVALDANGAAVSDVAVTDANGNYELEVSSTRNASGAPVDKITLRADAAGYQTVPLVTPPFPVDLSLASQGSSGEFALNNSLTALHLNKIQGGAGTASITGTLSLPQNQTSVLVVAELSGGGACPALPNGDCTSIAAQPSGSSSTSEGSFAIFNLPAGSYILKAYVQDTEYNSANVTLVSGQAATESLSPTGSAGGQLIGKVNIVNPGQGNATSVILVVESTLLQVNSGRIPALPVLIRGAMPPGLRAGNVTGDFTITGIPPGTYVILAAFEDDFLVRDPDLCIAGTDIIHQTFASGQTVNLSNPFKITGSLDVISPTQNEVVSPAPLLSWVDDSSEVNYEVMVFDNFGNKLTDDIIPSSSGANPEVTYAGPTLSSGNFYQFRVISLKNASPSCQAQIGSPLTGISATEDQKGVFQVQ